jgi:hypothetical protein
MKLEQQVSKNPPAETDTLADTLSNIPLITLEKGISINYSEIALKSDSNSQNTLESINS